MFQAHCFRIDGQKHCLRYRDLSRREQQEKVKELLELVLRIWTALSASIVWWTTALHWAFIGTEPKILLMDELAISTSRCAGHYSARRTIKEKGTTAILVTHDPDEAMNGSHCRARSGVIARSGLRKKCLSHPRPWPWRHCWRVSDGYYCSR